MSQYDTETLRLLSREHHQLRLHEANAERLARQLHGRPTRQGRRRPRLLGGLSPHPRQARRPHLTA
jgi:hypothetical protein